MEDQNENFNPQEVLENLPEDFERPFAGGEGINFDELIGSLDSDFGEEINDPLLLNPDSIQSIMLDSPLNELTTLQSGLPVSTLPIPARILFSDIDITGFQITDQIPFVNNDITTFPEESPLPFAEADSTIL
ncbi:MAG: hypothetical protein F6K54_04330 [Okeania sp. SIO3B5]|uniref:hypothetical protein n=1 Tax=Okeania sp. SIO3B5 TaxID=2607811 RepID=UPI0013FE7F07|nr:hypothetical protein [Okeania sp. SIO3B5]NEO52374.1 hypothetical protein [Okeania sp. SIO3B5]